MMTKLRKQARKGIIIFSVWLLMIAALTALYIVLGLSQGYINNVEAWTICGTEFVIMIALIFREIYLSFLKRGLK